MDSQSRLDELHQSQCIYGELNYLQQSLLLESPAETSSLDMLNLDCCNVSWQE